MSIKWFILALTILNPAFGDDDECKLKKTKINPIRLKKDLLCDYEKSVRPKINQDNATTINLRMVLKSIDFKMHGNEMTVNNWLALSWKDDHLVWKSDDYGGLTSIHMSSDEIWVPDLSLYNRNSQEGSAAVIGTVDCLVFSTGVVVCVPPTQQNAICIPDLTYYPFDSQNCTLRYGSWVHSGEELDFKFLNPAVSYEDYVENPEFNLLNVSVYKHPGHFNCCPDNTYPSLNFHFILKRHYADIAAAYIVPAIILILLTLCSFCLEIKSMERMAMCSCNMIVHFLYMQQIFWHIPSGGDKVPLILIYSRDSMFLAAFALILTVILRAFDDKTDEGPVWMSSVVSKVLGSRPGQILLFFDGSMKGMERMKPDDDMTNIIENSESGGKVSNGSNWSVFARIVNRIVFAIYFIVYLIMFAAFIP